MKKLNVFLIILLVVLVSIVSFIGIYKNEKGQLVNIIPSYNLGTDVEGYRRVTLTLTDKQNDTGEETAQITTYVNPDEDAKAQNELKKEEAEKQKEETSFTKCAEIMKARLKSLGVESYFVSVDESNGTIELWIAEDEQTDTILADITQKGAFVVKDAATDEVLMTNDDIKSSVAKIEKNYSKSGVTWEINFNNEGTKKFTKITKEYQNTLVDNNTTANDNSVDDAQTKSTPTYSGKQIKIFIDESELLATDFSEVTDNGVLKLTVGTSEDAAELKEKLYEAMNLAAIVENDSMTRQYEVKENVYVSTGVKRNVVKIIVCLEIIVAAILSLYLIAKFRLNGVMQTILDIGFMAVLLLVLRFANVIFSIEGIFTIGIAFIMNWLFSLYYCKHVENEKTTNKIKIEKLNTVIIKYVQSIAPIMIIGIVCSLTKWISILSVGTILFWACIISIVYNIALSKILIKQLNDKKQVVKGK